MDRKFVIADPATCIGCKTCIAACFHRHDVPNDVAEGTIRALTSICPDCKRLHDAKAAARRSGMKRGQSPKSTQAPSL